MTSLADSLDLCTYLILISMPVFVFIVIFYMCQYRKRILFAQRCMIYMNTRARIRADSSIPQIVISPGRENTAFDFESARASPIPFYEDVKHLDSSRLSPPPFHRA